MIYHLKNNNFFVSVKELVVNLYKYTPVGKFDAFHSTL